MITANRDLCIELHKLTGWDETGLWTNKHRGGTYDEQTLARHPQPEGTMLPLYPLGYLLRKLPPRIQDKSGTWFSLMGYPNGIRPWFAYKSALDGEDARWPNDQDIPFYKRVFEAGTPEDAACKLAIQLARRGMFHDPMDDIGKNDGMDEDL